MNAERVSLLIGRLQRSKLVRLMFGSSMLRGIGLGMTLLTSVALARTLGPAGLGYYSFALAVITVIGLPIHMGLPTLVLRETAKGDASGNWASVHGLWSWASRRIGWITLLTYAFSIPFLLVFGQYFVPDGGMPAIWISLALIPLIAIAQVRGAAVRGLHRPILGLLPDTIVRPATLGVLLFIAWWSGSTLSAESAMGLHIVAAVIASVLVVYVLYRLTPPALKASTPDMGDTPIWKRALVPLALLAGTQVVMQNANILLLGLWETPEQVGYFKVAVSASNLVVIGLTAMDMIIAPTFVKLYSLQQFRKLQRQASIGAILTMTAALPAAGLLWLYGEEILAFLYSPAFANSYAPMAILIAGQIVNAFFGSCGHLLNMSGYERISLRILVATMILNIALNALLIPTYGIVGSAIATASSIAVLNLAISIAVRAKLGIWTTPFGLLWPPKGLQDA